MEGGVAKEFTDWVERSRVERSRVDDEKEV